MKLLIVEDSGLVTGPLREAQAGITTLAVATAVKNLVEVAS